MKREKLDDVFTAACDALINGLKKEDNDGKAALVKSAVELLKYSGHNVEFEKSEPAKGVAGAVKLTLLDAGNRPPIFDDEKTGAVG